MPDIRSRKFELLKSTYLFRGLSDDRLARLVDQFDLVTLDEGERLFSAGDEGDNFYLIFDGRVGVTRQVADGDEATAELVTGDFFGEEALLFNRPRSATITSLDFTELLRLDRDEFYLLLREFPKIKADLLRTAESRRIVRTRRFDWLQDDEVIYQVARKHEAILVVGLLGPFLLGLGAVFTAFYVTTLPTLSAWAMIFFTGIVAVPAIGWGIWSWIDWGNDYYIVTNQRVVWIERVIWLYESREEAPLNTILSVNVIRSFLGRLIGFGSVIVRTFTGQIVLRNLGSPGEFAAMVEEYWHRAQQRSRREEEKEMEDAIRRSLGLVEEGEPFPFEPGKPVSGGPQRPPKPPHFQKSWTDRIFGNFFQLRIEEGKVITYRKYWTVLVFGKALFPTLIILFISLILFVATVFFFLGRLLPGTLTFLYTVGILLILLIFPWWFYHYWDWRNDIYQVTEKYIFDIERRPLGTEVRKSAPLENILSLEHRRVGLLGYLLNFGNVNINVGEARFTFVGVYDPARVQQDIFIRMHQQRQEIEKAEARKERDRIARALGMYYRNVEDTQDIEGYPDFE